MLGKISLQYESSYKNISTAKFYFKWLSLLYPRLLHFYFLRHTHWKNGENCHLSSFYLFLKKSTQFIERQQIFSAAPWISTANHPSFLHPLSAQRLIPSWFGKWLFQGPQQLPRVNRFGQNSSSCAVKCSLVSRANLLLTQTKMAHLRNMCGLTLPGFNGKYPLGFTVQLPFNVTVRQWGQRFSFFSSYFHQKGDTWQHWWTWTSSWCCLEFFNFIGCILKEVICGGGCSCS